MVDEGLRFSGIRRNPKCMCEHLLDEQVVSRVGKGLVKTQDGAGALQAIARKVQFVQSMHVLDVEFHRRSVRRLGNPKVEILVLSGLEEENVVTVVQLCHFVKLVQVLFRVELGFFSCVRHQLEQILDQVAVSVSDTTRRDHQDSLSVDVLGLFGTVFRQLRLQRFVDGRHGRRGR